MEVRRSIVEDGVGGKSERVPSRVNPPDGPFNSAILNHGAASALG